MYTCTFPAGGSLEVAADDSVAERVQDHLARQLGGTVLVEANTHTGAGWVSADGQLLTPFRIHPSSASGQGATT